MKAQTELFQTEVKSLLRPVEKMVADLLQSELISPEERAVAELLHDMWHVRPVTQRQIAKSKPWLGCHPRHEADVVANKFDTTTRQVRAVIRSLRVKHKLPVLADRDGYYLPKDDAEAKAYLERMEREARARARASIETYHSLRDSLGVSSKLFDELAKVGENAQ